MTISSRVSSNIAIAALTAVALSPSIALAAGNASATAPVAARGSTSTSLQAAPPAGAAGTWSLDHPGALSHRAGSARPDTPPCPTNTTWMTAWIFLEPSTWVELTGQWYQSNDGNWSICNGSTTVGTWTGGASQTPPNTYSGGTNIRFPSCVDCGVVVDPGGSALLITSYPKKRAPVIVATLSATGYSPVGVAVSKNQTVYASAAVLTGSLSSGVLVYAPGSTTPTRILSDPASGQSAAGIAVNPNTNDVYWAFNSSGSSTGRIDKFLRGQGTPTTFFESADAIDDVQIDLKGNLVVSSPAGIIFVLNSQGTVTGGWSTSGNPTSISLDKANRNIYVVDAMNAVVSEYTYPGGALEFSAPLSNGSSQPVLPATVQAHPAQK